MGYGGRGREMDMPVAKETLKLTTDTDGDDATVMVRGRTSLLADTWAIPGDNPTR